MMPSFLSYHLFFFSLTTTTTLLIVPVTLSLATFDAGGPPDPSSVLSTLYIPPSIIGNSNNDLLSMDDSPLADSAIQGSWGEGGQVVAGEWSEQAQANSNNDDDEACAGSGSVSKPGKRKQRRGEAGGDKKYCSPTEAPPQQLRPHFQQEEGSESGGSITTTTSTTGEQGGRSSSLFGPEPGSNRFDPLQPGPWTTAQSSCPGNRPVPVCAGADLQPWKLDQEWRQIPFTDPWTLTEMFSWPYCRLWTFNAPCKTELRLEMFMCCEYIEKNVPGERDTIFQLRVWRYMTLEYPYNGHSCVAAIEPRVRS